MNRKKHRLWTAVIAPALLALSLLTSSCVEPLDDSVRPVVDPNAQELTIRIYVPGNVPATKAGAVDVQGIDPESRIYGVQVWMFNHYAANVTTGDDETAVSYAEVSDLNWTPASNLPNGSGYYNAASGRWTDGSIYELPLRIPGYVLDRPDAQMRFDFYVLANGASIGSPAARTMTRGQLKLLTFGKTTDADWFGTTNPQAGTTPLNALGTNGPGLPISGFFNKSTSDTGNAASGVDLSFIKPENLKTLQQQTGFDIKALSPVVQLERAVAKVRFVFAKSDDMPGVQVTKIEINGEIIPNQTYVFPRENGAETAPSDASAYTGSGVVTLTGANGAPLLSNADILGVADPEALRSDSELVSEGQTLAPAGMTAQEYETFLTGIIGEKTSTQRYVYLRESGKPVKGKIYYKLNDSDTERSAEFSMPDPVTEVTNFHRNHSWIVYAYFNGGVMLEIKPYAMPWKYHENTTSFSSQVQCDGISVSGAIENTAAYMESHGGSENNYLSNLATGEVASAEDANYYANYYQVRRLLYGEGAQGYFEFKFTPRAPYGGYWMLEPFFYGSGSEDPQDMFRFEVLLADGGTSSNLMGQIIDRDVTIRIYPSSHYDYANDYNSYSVIFKSYFSPTIGFEPAYSADSELQDVHRDGRYSYWRFTLTHGDY